MDSKEYKLIAQNNQFDFSVPPIDLLGNSLDSLLINSKNGLPPSSSAIVHSGLTAFAPIFNTPVEDSRFGDKSNYFSFANTTSSTEFLNFLADSQSQPDFSFQGINQEPDRRAIRAFAQASANGQSPNEKYAATLQASITTVRSSLQQFFDSPEYLEKLQTAFGGNFDQAKATQLWESYRLPEIEVVPADILHGADGAFAISNNTIYLADTLISSNNPNHLNAVLLEEIGHHIDSIINQKDAAGDEGAIFADLVSGVQISSSEYIALVNENDHSQIYWSGQSLDVENAVPSGFAVKAEGLVTFNGSSDLDGNPTDQSDDSLIYAGKGFTINGNAILPVQLGANGQPVTNGQGKLVLVDRAVSVTTGYLQANVNGTAKQYANLTPPQIIAAQTVEVPNYVDIKQLELGRRIPIGASTVTFNISQNPLNTAAQWAQLFPVAGTASQPKVVKVIGGGLNIPATVNLSNYVITVDNGDINFNGSGNLSNVVLVTNNGNINLNGAQADNLSVLASGTINHNSSARFGGISLFANGTGNITFNGATKGITATDNLRIISAGSLIFNGAKATRGTFLSKGDFISNGTMELYGTVGSKQNIIFNGATTITYASIATSLDTTAPTIAASLVRDSAPDNLTNSDKITNDSRISGTVTDANSITEFKAGFDSQAAASFTNVLPYLQNGTFSFTKAQLEQIYGGVIPDGVHTLNLTAKDQYGNQSSYAFGFTLDTMIASPSFNLAATSDTGVAGDYRTKLGTVVLTGKTDANARVLLSGVATLVTADSLGSFSFSNVLLNLGTNNFTVTATDVAGNEQTYSHEVYRTSPPTGVGLSTPKVFENSINSTLVGQLSTIDLDGADNYVYSLVDNVGGRFKLVGDRIQVDNGGLLDFEQNRQHQIQVQTTDSEGDSYLQAIAINILDVNEAPTALTLDRSIINENVAAGSLVGNLATTDPDLGDSHAYSLVAGLGGTDNDAFVITNNQLRFLVSPDFETKSSYSLRVRTTDAGGLSVEKAITVNVINVNEAPTQLVLNLDQVAEISPVDTLIGRFTSTDPDLGDSHTYSLVAGNGDADNSRLAIVGNELRLNVVPDYETQSLYHLRVQTKDAGGLTWEQELMVTILDVVENHSPTAILLTNSSVAENSAKDTLITKLRTTDVDVTDTHTYTLLDDAGGRFKLVSDELRVADGSLLDFETAQQHQIRVRTVDSGNPGLAYEQMIAIDVTNVNDSPIFTSSPILSVDAGKTYSYTITTTDLDSADTRQISTGLPLPGWLQLVDNGDGTATLSGNPSANDTGFSKISLVVTDRAGVIAVQEFNVGVATTLVEGTRFANRLEVPLTIPATGGRLSFKLAEVAFDFSDTKDINDALEVALVDAQGRSLVRTFQSGRDGFFNWTEGEEVVTGQGTDYDQATGLVTLDVTGVKSGAATLVFRLVNNDKDTTTTVRLTDLVLSPNPTSGSSAGDGLPPAEDKPSPVAPGFFNNASDISPSIVADYHRTSFNADGKNLFVNIALKNQGTYGVGGFLVAVVNHISDPSVQVLDADGFTPEGLPYYTFTTSSGRLDPNDVSIEKVLVFKNPNGVQFSYDLTILGEINSAPVIKSQPELEIIAGQKYQYQVKAEDINGDTLSYKLLSAPEGLEIDPTAGLLSWETTPAQIGSYRLSVEVNDGRGGVTQQDYNLTVTNAPPNRPPVFTSTPIVNANINVRYRYDANAVDPDRDQLIYKLINGPEGLQVDPSTGEVSWNPPATTVYGDTVIGSISNPGERDSFTFSGEVGQRLFFDPLKYTGLASDWSVQLYDPYGNLVTSNGFGYEGPFTLTQTGNYKLVVETNGANKGQYAFSLIDVAAVPNLEFDRLVSGTLAPGSEADLFRFVGTAGENLYFDKLSSYSNLNWILYSPQNDTIWLDGWADKEFKLPYSGEYLLALRGQGSFAATGDYKFNVVTPDVVITQLELNRTISGAIVDKGEQHIYTFAGNAGQQLFYDSMGRDYLSLKLLDPAGNTIFTDYTNSDRGPDQGFTLTATGTYQVVVDGIGEGTGSYQFRLLDRTTSQTAALDTDLVGRLDNLLAAQGYQFSLNSDRYIYFDAQAGSGQWLLYGGDGKNLVAHPLSGDRELKLVAGDYFLVFQGNGSGDANYKMRLVTPEFITTPLVFNTVVTGNISEAGEQDTFTFDGVAGQRLFYDALGGSNLTKKIYDPSGKEVSSPFLDVRTDVGPDYYVLSSSGTYRVVIDGADTNIGSYKFRLIDESAASVINFDQEVTGTIDQDGLGATIYKFAAIAGQHLYLNASVSQSTNSWIIYAPNGQQMSSASLQSSYEFDVKSTGDYLLCIQGNGTVDRNYKFTLTDSNNAISSFALGEKVDGRIAKQGQQNTYVFQGTVGQQLYFDALGSTNASNEIVSIYNRSGVEVLRRSFSNIDAGDVIVLKETGDYRVVVDGFGGSTDSYSFRLSDVQSAAVSISRDADVVGQLVSGQETNFYKFNGIQGQRIQLNSLVSTPNTSMTLYDIVGDAVITAGATTTLTSTGQYIIGVRGYNNGSVNYGFRVVTISTPSTSPISNATPINLNTTVGGAISVVGGQNTYSFNGVAGQQLFYDSLGGDSFNLKLLGPAGKQLLSIDSRTDVGPSQGLTLTANGTYQLVVTGVGIGIGNYQFRLLDKLTSPVITLDTELVGRLDNLSGSQGYRFSLDSERNVYIDTQSLNTGNQWYLYGSEGGNLVTASLNTDRELKLVAGEYFLVVRGNGAGDPNYRVRLATSQFITTPLAFNTVVTGGIDKAGEQDIYTFEGIAGQRLFYDALGSANLARTIYDPEGKALPDSSQNANSDIGPNYYILSRTGTYKVVIDGSNETTGNYKFRLIDESAAVPIVYGTEIAGTVGQNGVGSNIYKFSATVGQHLYLNTGDGQVPNAWIIYSPNGQQLSSGYIQSNNFGQDDYEFDVTASGDYLLFIQGNGAANLGYKFTLTDSGFTNNALVLGETISGKINKEGQQNTYSFTAVAGQQLYLDILGPSVPTNNIARLYNQSGTEILNRNLSTLDPADLLVLKETGNYRLVIDGFRASTDAYSFRLLDTRSSATSLILDTDITGQLPSGQETKLYTFTGGKGQRLYLDCFSNSPNTAWTLYDPTGRVIDNRLVADYETTLASDGQYTLAIRGSNNGNVNYSFRVVTSDTTITPIEVGGNNGAVISGSIAERGELDVYTFVGTVGQRLLLDRHAIDPAVSLNIYTPSGVVVNADNLLTLIEAGTYRVVLSASGGGIGNYAFRLLDKASATSVSFDTEISGNFGGDLLDNDLYRFDGAAGQRLFISSTGTPTNTWSLYTPSGKIATVGSLGRDTELDLPDTGDYLLVLNGNPFGDNGYRFTVFAPSTKTKSLELGSVVAGSISKFGQSDAYSFAGKIGQQLYFDGLTGNPNIKVQLYSPTGRLLKDVSTVGDLGSFTLTEAGIFKLVFDGVGRGIGDYSFKLSDRSLQPTITFGQTIASTIAAGNAVDLYQFNGVNGQKLFFDLTNTNLGLGSWLLYNQSNEVTISSSGDFRTTLTGSGLYTLAVLGSSNGATNYGFTVINETPVPVVQSGLQVVEGEVTGTFAGSISPGQVFESTFTASSGTRIYLDSRDVDDNNLNITVLNPDGSNVFITSASIDQRLTQLSQTGTYRIRVQGVSPTAIGDYDFALMNVQTSEPDRLADVRKLTLNAEITKPLENGYSTHILTFEGKVGQRLLYDGILADNANFNSYLVGASLIDPRGKDVFRMQGTNSYGSAGDFGPFTLTESGTYNLEIIGNQLATAQYRFKLLDLTAAQDLTLNRTYADNLLRGSDTNLYKFSGKAGDHYYFDSIAGRNTDFWTVYGPGNSAIVVNNSLASDFELTLPTDGEYVLAVRGNSTTSGTYRFSAIAPKDGRSVLLPGAGESGTSGGEELGVYGVKLGVSDSKGGTAEQSFKIRVLPEPGNTEPTLVSNPILNGFTGKRYTYDVDASDGNTSVLSYVLVDAPAGMFINGDTGEISWQSPEVGSHTVKIRVQDGSGGQDTQSYTLNITAVTPGVVKGNVYLDKDRNGIRKLANPNNLTPDTLVTIGDRFKQNYQVYDLGVIPGAPYTIGAMTFWQDPATGAIDPNTMLVGVGSENCGGAIFKVKVLRGEGGHIIGFDDDADVETPYVTEFYAYAPYISGSLYYESNTLKWTTRKSAINSAGIVPSGLPGAGQIKGISKTSGGFYSLGSPNILETTLGNRPAGFVYEPATATDFSAGPEILIAEYGEKAIYAYELDANGNPILSTKDLFVGNYNGPLGIVIDPVTGDVLFDGYKSVFNNNVQIARGLGPLSGNEAGLKSWLVYVDQNKDGIRQADEQYTYTDANGGYSFALTPGNYQIRQELQPGWQQTSPTSPVYRSVTLTTGQIVYGVDFGNGGADANVKPTFITTPVLEVVSNEKYLYRSKATDLNGDELTYQLVDAPVGMAIAADGSISWRPGDELVGTHRVAVKVTDSQGETDLQTFMVNVKQGNRRPIVTSLAPDTHLQVGRAWSYQTTAIDLDRDTLTYSLVPNAAQPTGVSIDSATGKVSWTPTAAQIGGSLRWGAEPDAVDPWQVTVKVSDGKGGEALQSLSLMVDGPAPNRLPMILSTPRNVVQTESIYLYQIKATDPDGDGLSYSLVNGPLGMTLTGDVLAWTPSTAQSGMNQVSIEVKDGRGGVIRQNFGIDVSNLVTNHVPEISSVPKLVTDIDRAYEYNLVGTDLDGDVLIWSLEQAPVGMVLDANTGRLRWQPTVNQVGTHPIAVRLMDPYGAYTVQEYELMVNGINTPPQIQSNPITQGATGQVYKYQVVATDVDGDALTYALGRHPAGMVIDRSGLIGWKPGAEQLGTQEIEVLVTDARGAIGKQSYQLVVGNTPINQAPSITSQPLLMADVGRRYQYQVVASDPENSEIAYELKNAPLGMSISSTTGLVTWDAPLVGNYQVVVIATDVGGAGVAQGYTLTARQNHLPTIQSVPKLTALAGLPYRYDLVARDTDGDLLTYKLDEVSQGLGMTIDHNGRLVWNPTNAQLGVHQVTLSVQDSPAGEWVNQSYSLEVLADNAAPTIKLVRGTNIANIGETVTFQVQATDNAGIRSKQLLVNGQAIALDSNGVATYKTTSLGVVTFTALVTDINGNTSSTNTTVNVIDPTDAEAPTLNFTVPSGDITGLTDIVGTVADTNLAYYTFSVAPLGSGNFQEVFRGQGNVTNGLLGTFDPTGLQNDTYILRVEAVDVNGHINRIDREINVTGDLKLGNFRLSFTDIAIPVTGVPITLTRTYDTLTANNRDDFGYGWRMEFRDTDLRTSLKPDREYEELGYRTVGFQDGDKVYITLPGGQRETFIFNPKQLGTGEDFGSAAIVNGVLGGKLYKPSFDADKGVTSTLTVPGGQFNFNLNNAPASSQGNSNNVLLRNKLTNKVANMAGRPYRPEDIGFGNTYLLTTKDGTVYDIDATTGKLRSVTDTNGNTLTYTDNEISSSTGQKVTFDRDAQGRIVAVTDPLGQKIKYEYDAKGDLVAVTDRDNNKTQFQYNAGRAHYLDKIIDPLGREAVKTEYDEKGRLKKTLNVAGNGVSFDYDPANSLQTVKDALGNATTYEYDKRGNVVRSIDPMGGTTLLEYDDDNHVIKSIDPNNLVTKYTYDANGNLTSRSETYCGCPGIVPGATTYTYNKWGQQTSVTLPTGATVFQDYDDKGNLLTMRDGKGSVIMAYTYDSNGNVLSETSGGTTTTYKYDSRGNVVEMIDPDGTITKTEYDANNRLSKMIEADGSISTFTYDKEGRQTKADYGNGLFVNYSYTATSPDWTVIEGPTIGRIERKFTSDGKLGGWVTPEGNITFTYDAAGRLWKETQPDGRTTEYTYDAAGRVIQTKDLSTGATASKTYSVGGQLLTETDSLGRTTSYTYDRNGQVASTTNALGQTYSYIYAGSSVTVIDPLGRKTTSTNNDYYLPSQTTYANGAKSSIEYLYTNNLQEAKDYPTKIVDIAGRIRRYTYNSSGNLATTTDLAGQAYTYGYGANGVSDITSPTGAKINYEYDDKGNLTKLSYGTQLGKSYGYDTDGNLKTVTNASGSKITNVYDAKGQISSQTLTEANGSTSTIATAYNTNGSLVSLTNSTGTTSYQYDADGNVSQMTSANGSIISYVRDAQGRVLSQTEKANAGSIGLTTSYTYDVYGKVLTVTDSRNRTTTMTYDVVNRLATKTLPNGVKTTYGYDDLDRIINLTYAKADGTVLVSETYTRNIGGEPSKVTREDGSYTLYEYDAAVRLSKESVYNPSGAMIESVTYSYDLDGKRTRKVDAAGTHNYNYNADSQLTNVGSDQYGFDVDGRLHQLTRDGKTIVLNHDVFDRITQVSVNGVNTQYLYDAQGNRIGEVSGNGTKNYLVAPNLSNGLESTDLVTDSSSNVISDYVYGGSSIIARLDASGDPIYYLTDSMGSVIGLVDGQGKRISRIIYDGFGEVKSGDDGTSLGGDFRFQGQWLESESSLYYMRARDYDAETGLFLSRDPVDVQEQSVEAFNPYQFAFNNPLIYSDPTGMFTMIEINTSLSVRGILDKVEAYAVSQVKDYLIDKARGLVGDLAASAFRSLLPSQFGDIYSAFREFPGGKGARTAGERFEAAIQGAICSVIGSANYYPDALWLEPAVSIAGKPLTSGYNCKQIGNTQGNRKGVDPKTSAFPDFIFKSGNPLDRTSKAWLIGDFKYSLKTVASSADSNGNQWQAITNHAKYQNQHQYAPIVAYFTFSGGGKKQLLYVKQLEVHAVKAGVALFVYSL